MRRIECISLILFILGLATMLTLCVTFVSRYPKYTTTAVQKQLISDLTKQYWERSLISRTYTDMEVEVEDCDLLCPFCYERVCYL